MRSQLIFHVVAFLGVALGGPLEDSEMANKKDGELDGSAENVCINQETRTQILNLTYIQSQVDIFCFEILGIKMRRFSAANYFSHVYECEMLREPQICVDILFLPKCRIVCSSS
jgi:hypothetical protein